MRIARIAQFATVPVFALLLGLPAATAQESGMDHSKHAQMQASEQQEDMSAKCKAMMQEKQKMMQKCQMMETKLDELVSRMNAATGPEKIEAMQELLDELVAQRKSMHAMMHKMMQEKMGMMSMGEGMSKGDMSKCNMMKNKKMMQMEGSSGDASAK